MLTSSSSSWFSLLPLSPPPLLLLLVVQLPPLILAAHYSQAHPRREDLGVEPTVFEVSCCGQRSMGIHVALIRPSQPVASLQRTADSWQTHSNKYKGFVQYKVIQSSRTLSQPLHILRICRTKNLGSEICETISLLLLLLLLLLLYSPSGRPVAERWGREHTVGNSVRQRQLRIPSVAVV